MTDKRRSPSILFFGSMAPPDEAQGNPCSSYSANRFQYELLGGLLESRGGRVTAICPIPLYSYPHIARLLVPGRETSPRPGLRIVSPPFVNWGPLKVLSLILTVAVAAMRAWTAWGRPEIILVYNPYLGYGIPALALSRLLKVPVVGIVADLRPPGRVTPGTALRELDSRLQSWLARRFDAMLPFSTHTPRDLGFLKPCVRLDPGISAAEFSRLEPLGSDRCERALFFSGTLNAENGLELLLESFAGTRDRTIQLWISGRGEMQTRVEALAGADPRVRYLGFLERADLLERLRRSLVLVNPRPAGLPENRYNFPSKILEYLATGRPVISLASGDIADEYGAYLILLADEAPGSFARLIDETFRKSPEELDRLGRAGRDHVLREKNWTVLAARVNGFLDGVVSGGRP